MQPVIYIGSAVLVFFVAFIVFRVAVRLDYLRAGRLSPLSTLLEYVAIGLWAYFGYLNRPPDWPAVHVAPALQVMGCVLFAGGWAVALFGIFRLGLRRTHGLQVNTLRQTGLYRLTRNPQVVAFLVAIVGYVVLWPTWRNLGVLILLVPLVHMMILGEEEHLEDVFGEEYVSYRDRAPRYLRVPRYLRLRPRKTEPGSRL